MLRTAALEFAEGRMVIVLVGVLGGVLGDPALAGPPLQTDDPDTPEKGLFEPITSYTLSLSRGDGAAGRTRDQEAPLFDLNYGLAEGVQVKFEAPLAVLDPADGASAREDRRCVDRDEAAVRARGRVVAVGVGDPAVGVPLGSRGRGLGTGSPSLTLPVQAGRRFFGDQPFVCADGGYREQLATGEDDVWFMGIAAEWQVAEGSTLSGETRYQIGVRGAPDSSLLNVGVKWRLREYASFIGSAGKSFSPRADSGSELLLYLRA